MNRALLVGFCVLLLSDKVEGQELPFTLSVVDWQPDLLERQRRGYRSASGEGEALFCIESWTTAEAQPGLDRIAITAVRRVRTGEKHRVRDVGNECLGPDGMPQPMIHTHSDGNCQFSPADLVTAAARSAAFEGVQCGDRHFIWIFAWQVRAMAESAERERLARVAGRP